MAKYEMTIDLNVLNHLGINLYSNISAILSEAVANAWDADAENVKIIADITDPASITILDDGCGMSSDDINEKFLKVGYQKRHEMTTTPIKNRPVMGRKGIGKLSLFSIAKTIEIHSFKDGEANGFILDLDKIQNQIKSEGVSQYQPEEVDVSNIELKQPGTFIKLTNLYKRHRALDKKLKTRISRRFSVLNDDFVVNVNGKDVSIQDRDYFKNLQDIWHLSEENNRYYDASGFSFKNEAELNEYVEYTYIPEDLFEAASDNKNEKVRLNGWIGGVKESGNLKEGVDNLNKISLVVRGKVAKEDILPYVNEDRVFTKYLIGEIHADFLDDDDKKDIATSSRQDFSESDPRFEAMLEKVSEIIKSRVARDWTEWRKEKATKEALESTALKSWYKSLSSINQKEAKKLFGKIGALGVPKEKEKELLKQGVLGFERLRMSESLDQLDDMVDALDPRFELIFNTIDDLEAVLYHDIAKGRVNVVGQLEQKVSDNELEKLIQKFLFDHLWLLDPSWDRATEAPAHMESSLEKMFSTINDKLTSEEKAGRLDIKYRTSAGKHIIIELKKPDVKTDIYALLKQTEKYFQGLKKMLQNQGEANPAIESICIVGKTLSGWEDSAKRQDDLDMAKGKNTRVILYEEIISNSKKAYAEYLETEKEVSRIQELLEKL